MPALLFELSNWTQIEMTGRDRQSFLHGFCTNDIKRLTPGQGCEAFLSNIKGRVIGHIWAFADDRRLCLESEPGQAAAIITHLDKYLIAEDVQLTDRTNDWRLLLLTGDDAGDVLRASGVCDAPPTTIGEHRPISGVASHDSIRRCDFTEEPCWTIPVRAAAAEELRQRLISAGAALSDGATFETLRIEHGYPLFCVDLSEDNLVHESDRVSQTVSFNKGCYLGQEPIARLDSLGHVNRHLCRLRIATTAALSSGSQVLSVTDGESEPAGHVTSVAPNMSNDGKRAVIALLKRAAAAPGTRLKVEISPGVHADAIAEGA